MSTEPTLPRPSFGERLATAFIHFVRALVRLLFVVLLAVGIGAGAYFGLPALYRTYVQPVEDNAARIAELQARLDVLEAQNTHQQEAFSTRLDDLERRADAFQATVDDLQSRLAAAETALQTAQQDQADLLAQLDALQQQVDDLAGTVAQLGQDVLDNQRTLADLDSRWTALDTPLAALRREVALSRVMARLTRARVFLAHNNLGLAADEIAAALADLDAMRPTVADYQQAAFQAIVDRLQTAQGNLPDQPVLAAEDLDAAWHLLSAGLPAEPPLSAETTPTPTETPAPTATPSP